MSAALTSELAAVAGAEVRGLLDVGEDGACFAGAGHPAGEVEVWRLAHADIAEGMRRRLRVLADNPHPGLLRLVDVALDQAEPHVIVADGPLQWSPAFAEDAAALRGQVLGLVEALAHAHRWGLMHGTLGLGQIARGADGRLRLDLTGLRVRAPVPVELAPEHRQGAVSVAATFLQSVEEHYEANRRKRNPCWNFIYGGMTAKEIDLDGSVFWLKEFPIDRRYWGTKNSHREDVRIVKRPFVPAEADPVLPPDERRIHKWNTNELDLDGHHAPNSIESGGEFLFPYWLGRFFGYLSAPAGS